MNAACGTAWHRIIERKVVSIIESFLHCAGDRQACPGVTNGRGARTDTSALAIICLARTVSAVLLLKHLTTSLRLTASSSTQAVEEVNGTRRCSNGRICGVNGSVRV